MSVMAKVDDDGGGEILEDTTMSVETVPRFSPWMKSDGVRW